MDCTINILQYASPILGLIGTILIFFFGVPKQIDTEGKIGLCFVEEDEEEKVKIKKYKFRGNLGLILIGISFLLQLAILLLQEAK